MNYQKIHNQIVDRAQKAQRTKREGYFEKHHIIPRSWGGSNLPENLVLLTAREHFICHCLLVRFSAGVYKMKAWNALFFMFSKSKHQQRYSNSRFYEKAKQEFALIHSARQKGSVKSSKTRSKQSKKAKQVWQQEREQGVVRDYSNSKGPLGHKQSTEHVQRRAVKKRKQINVYGQVFDSMTEAVTKSGYTHWHITTRLKQKDSKVFYVN